MTGRGRPPGKRKKRGGFQKRTADDQFGAKKASVSSSPPASSRATTPESREAKQLAALAAAKNARLESNKAVDEILKRFIASKPTSS